MKLQPQIIRTVLFELYILEQAELLPIDYRSASEIVFVKHLIEQREGVC